MKIPVKAMIMLLICCICFSTSFAATSGETAISENDFISELVQIGKNEAVIPVGTDELLTREKAAELITTYLGYEAIAREQSNTYRDVTSSQGAINLVSSLGIMSGTGDRVFAPDNLVTESQARVIIGRIQNKLAQPVGYRHAFYAINSGSQKEWIADYDAVSFGWAQLQSDSSGEYTVSTSSLTGDFKVPSGFEEPLDLARANGTEAFLMIYFQNKGDLAKNFLSSSEQKKKVINQIVNLSQGVTKDGIVKDFDGITIDFENFTASELKAPYSLFLQELSTALKAAHKKLNVAVQPTTYFKGYDYSAIGEAVDHIILMAHDYGAKSLSQTEKDAGVVTTPLTPIDDVYLTLAEASQSVADKSKIVLQFSFDSIQWKSQNQKVLNGTAYTPSYDKIEARLALPGTSKHFDSYYQSTYASYEENDISNIIWYEDQESIQAKIDLAKLLGITGTSYWRLGMIPEEFKLNQ